MKKDKKAEKRTASKPTADERVMIQNKKLASFVATIRSSDDLMAQIADTNEQLDAGKITAEHARAKASNYKAMIKLLDAELEAGRLSGKLDPVIERWFSRVAKHKGLQASVDQLRAVAGMPKAQRVN